MRVSLTHKHTLNTTEEVESNDDVSGVHEESSLNRIRQKDKKGGI